MGASNLKEKILESIRFLASNFFISLYLLLDKIDIEEDKECITACVAVVNGRVIFRYNPDFIKYLKRENDLHALVLHELMHIVFDHCSKNRQRKILFIMNIAADIVVNEVVEKIFGSNNTIIEKGLTYLKVREEIPALRRYETFEYYYDELEKHLNKIGNKYENYKFDEHLFKDDDKENNQNKETVYEMEGEEGRAEDKKKNEIEEGNKNDDIQDELNDTLEKIKSEVASRHAEFKINKKDTIVNKNFIKEVQRMIKETLEKKTMKFTKNSIIKSMQNVQPLKLYKKDMEKHMNLIIGVDTSGSMTTIIPSILTKCFSVFCNSRFKEMIGDIMYIENDDDVKFQKEFANVTEFVKWLNKKDEYNGGGGTLFESFFRMCYEKVNQKHVDLIIFITDMEAFDEQNYINLIETMLQRYSKTLKIVFAVPAEIEIEMNNYRIKKLSDIYNNLKILSF